MNFAQAYRQGLDPNLKEKLENAKETKAIAAQAEEAIRKRWNDDIYSKAIIGALLEAKLSSLRACLDNASEPDVCSWFAHEVSILDKVLSLMKNGKYE